MQVHDTDCVVLDRELRLRLEEQLTADGDCLLAGPAVRSIEVRLRFHRFMRPGRRAYMSIARVAFALAHRAERLVEEDFVIHTCRNTGIAGRRLCCHPGHLRKGTRDDVAHAKALRPKGFLAA